MVPLCMKLDGDVFQVTFGSGGERAKLPAVTLPFGERMDFLEANRTSVIRLLSELGIKRARLPITLATYESGRTNQQMARWCNELADNGIYPQLFLEEPYSHFGRLRQIHSMSMPIFEEIYQAARQLPLLFEPLPRMGDTVGELWHQLHRSAVYMFRGWGYRGLIIGRLAASSLDIPYVQKLYEYDATIGGLGSPQIAFERPADMQWSEERWRRASRGYPVSQELPGEFSDRVVRYLTGQAYKDNRGLFGVVFPHLLADEGVEGLIITGTFALTAYGRFVKSLLA